MTLLWASSSAPTFVDVVIYSLHAIAYKGTGRLDLRRPASIALRGAFTS